jgi:hypothetical protein
MVLAVDRSANSGCVTALKEPEIAPIGEKRITLRNLDVAHLSASRAKLY